MSIYKNGTWKEDKINELDDKSISGENIDILDSANSILKEFNIEGKTEQKSTQGNQQWDYFSYPTTQIVNGVTITNNKDGTITLDGECDTDNTTFAVGTGTFVKNLAAEGPITHTAYYISGTCTGYAVIRINYNQSNSMIRLENLQASEKITKTQAQSTATSGWSWGFRIDSSAKFNNFRFRYQLNKGSTELPWEEYTDRVSSPSPSYEQSMKSIGDNINLIDFSNPTSITGSTSLSLENDILTMSSTENTYRYASWDIKDLVKSNIGKVLYFIYDNIDITNQYGEIVQLQIRYSGSQSYTYVQILTHNLISKKWTIPSDAADLDTVNLQVCVNNSSTSQEASLSITKPKFQFGVENKLYSPYNMGVISIERCNKNLFDKNTAIDGKEINNTQNGAIIDSAEWFITDYIPCKPGTNYVVSGKANGQAILYYDKDKNFIIGTGSGGNTAFTSINNPLIAYMILNGKLTQKDTFQLEFGITATDYVVHQSQTYPIYTQSPFKSIDIADDFINMNGTWYEKHLIGESIFDASEDEDWYFETLSSNRHNFYINIPTALGGTNNKIYNNIGVHNTTLANNYNCYISAGATKKYLNYICNEIDNLEDFKTMLESKNMIVTYKLAEPILLPCTDKQVEQIEAIINDGTYQGETHYFSNDEIKPLMNIIYFRDWDKNLQTKNQIYEDKILSNKFIEI